MTFSASGLGAARTPLFLSLLLGICLTAQSAEPVHFPIRSFVVDGSTQFTESFLQSRLSSFVGPEQTFSSIQQAVSAMQQAYEQAGYAATLVTIPEQDISSGVVHLRVSEAVIGSIEVSGNNHFDEDNVLYTLPGLKKGSVPNINVLGRAIRLANLSYAKQEQLTLKSADQPQTVNAIVRLQDDAPVRNIVSLDNSGNDATGQYRLAYAFQHANMFNRDHTLSAQYVTSPDHSSDVRIFGLSYRIPFYSLGSTFDISASHSNVNSGSVATAAGSYDISGSGNTYSLGYTQLLPRWAEWDHRIITSLDYKYFQSMVQLSGSGGTSLVPDLISQPVNITYSGFRRTDDREWGLTLGYSQNIPGYDKNTSGDYQQPGGRANADAAFGIAKYSYYLKQPLPANWLVSFAANGQDSSYALISGEQFGLGGSDSVRGFSERQVTNDRGYRASLEVMTPDLGSWFGSSSESHLQLLCFYDAGEVWRNQALPSEITDIAISSAGLGLRYAYGRHFSARLDYASVINGGGVRNTGDQMAHANLVLMF